ncbi:flavin-binding monooxygenase-like protein-like protein [Lentithecium fluviatile CBS 122367]|uniref:Flavin-binding monooxygenase-like protein-like protein n=1 Tax=Lentithecium fluviatile CBS 122367 TaxID=1168545 RepID=A0A6G1IG47_9PLEO|nr:flavin-binding monooxygenase-like protein-like protein [Lentithecium fluviatile CBS 122367]
MAPPTQRAADLDLLIIGSGIYAIQAARTYLTLHPTHSITLLEADTCPGGVWGRNRIYDEFWTQTPLGIHEFSDKPLQLPEGSSVQYEYFQAKHFTAYLEKYLDEHVYEGKNLRERIVFNARVEKLWKEEGLWYAKTNDGKVYTAPKVIDASGQTSIPDMPTLPGADTFAGEILHHKDFGRSSLLQTHKRVVVIGGAKSAADVAYACAKAGLQVSWVIRKSGNGPAAYFPPESKISYYSNSNAAFHQRAMASLSVCIFTPESWWTVFLNRTVIGRAFLRTVWGFLQGELYERADYDREDGKENGFKNLKPDTGLFWQNDSSGVTLHPDFFDTFATKVKVYREDFDHIDKEAICLADGTRIETDAIVYATGWKQTTPYLEPETAYTLGLATNLSAENPEKAKKWAALEKVADAKVLHRFPILKDPPPCYKAERKSTPFRLYKSMIPIHDHSIAFLGKLMMANHAYCTEVQALFAVAVLDGVLTLPETAVMQEEVALVRAWQERRYPAKGYMGNWFFYDIVPYTDAMLAELRLSSHRTGGMKDFVRPALASNLRGLLAEYKENAKQKALSNS